MEKIHLIGTRPHDLPAFSIVPQQIIVEEKVKMKSHGKSERHFIVGEEESASFFRTFPGFAHSSF
jgi:hypothetical protein